MIIPCVRFSFCLGNTQTHRRTAAVIATIASTANAGTNATGVISAVVPTTNKILNTLRE